MTTISHRVPAALTPPTSSHGQESSWNFSVPAQSQELNTQSKQRRDIDNDQLADPTGPSTYHANSRSDLNQRHTDTCDSTMSSKPGLAGEQFLAPARVSALNRKDSNVSETGSAPDSLLDLYGRERSQPNSLDLRDGKRKEVYDDDDPERSRWIHRDKLLRIENQELQAAGIILPRMRPGSKNGLNEHDSDMQKPMIGKPEQSQLPAITRQQHPESLPGEDAEESQMNDWDLRLPGEASAETQDGWREYNGTNQKGTSKIPLFKSSPLPIPLEHIERDTPVQRTRGYGRGSEEDGIMYPKSRERSQSVKVLNEIDTNSVPGTHSNHDGSTASSKQKSIPGARKTSVAGTRATSAQSRPKTRSGPRDTPHARPVTRSGDFSNVFKAPEGDPPWLTNTYKPDPSLPPDQQLLPTVAKRLQQQQWEKEGRFGTAYDKEFRPLNDDQIQEHAAVVPQMIEVAGQKTDTAAEWPLSGPKSPVLSSGRPGTAGGTYSTMPKIDGVHSPLQSPRIPAPMQITRVQEIPQETRPKKGCGCLIM